MFLVNKSEIQSLVPFVLCVFYVVLLLLRLIMLAAKQYLCTLPMTGIYYLLSHRMPFPSLPPVPRYIVGFRAEKDTNYKEIYDHEARVSPMVEWSIVCSIDIG